MTIRISYPLDRKAPLYSGMPPITFSVFKSIERGDSSNNIIISLSSHAGTHIDVPRHFCQNGKSVLDLLDDVNVIEPVYCYDLLKKPGESINVDDFTHMEISKNTKALLIRTGFYRYRNANQDIYTLEHPWVHPDVPELLRKKYPNLLLFGIDTISISNPAQRTLGHDAHRSFLCKERPILLLEDVNLSNEKITNRRLKLNIYPLIIDELDSVPVFAFVV